jgi:hypothetical protein
MGAFLSSCGVLALVLIVSRWRTYLGRLISENNLLIPAVVGLLVLWFGSAFLLNQFEGEVNERLSSFPRALRYGLFYISPGESLPTLTENGQIIQRIGQWIVGVVLLGGVFAPFVTRKLLPQGLSRLALRMMRRGAVREKLNGHVVLINHSPRTNDLIKQLHAPRIRNRLPIVVIAHANVSFAAEPEFDDVFTVIGDITEKAVWEKAQIERAHSVAILSAWPPPDKRPPKILEGRSSRQQNYFGYTSALRFSVDQSDVGCHSNRRRAKVAKAF